MLLALLESMVGVTPARATFPGSNGKIAFTGTGACCDSVDVYVGEPDGSGLTTLTRYQAIHTDPVFSPDGLTIAFTRIPSPGLQDVWVMNSDGSATRA